MQQTTQISKISVADPKQFIDIFKFYKRCNNTKEISLLFDKNKISFREINLDNTLMTSIEISSSFFTEWYANEGKKSLNAHILIDFLNRVDAKKDVLGMEFNGDKYKVDIKGYAKRQFSSFLLDIESEPKKMPELRHNTRIKINAKTLCNALKGYKKSEMESIKLIADKNKLKLNIFDWDNSLKDSIELNAEVSGNAISKYNFELFRNSITSRLTEDILLLLDNDYPILISYVEPNYKADVIIAPRVEDSKDKPEVKPEAVKTEIKEPVKEEATIKEKAMPKLKRAIKAEKSLKIDLNDIGYSDSLGCPHCKGIIDIQHFSSKFTTPIGLIRDIVEEEHKSNIEFLEFVLDKGIDDEINKDFKKMIKDKLIKYLKMFGGG